MARNHGNHGDGEFLELASLLPAVDLLEVLARMLTEAEEIYTGLPLHVRDSLKEKSSVEPAEMALRLATVNPDLRRATFASTVSALKALKAVVEAKQEATNVVASERDIELVRRYLALIPSVGSRSKRENERFYDAIESSDTGYLVKAIRLRHGKPVVEMRFTAKLPDELVEMLGI